MSASLDHPRKHPISAEEYLRMDAAGPSRAIHVFRDPFEGEYRSAVAVPTSGHVTCEALPAVVIEVAEPFPD